MIYAKSLHFVWRVFWISNRQNDEYRTPGARGYMVQREINILAHIHIHTLTHTLINPIAKMATKKDNIEISIWRNEMWSLFFLLLNQAPTLTDLYTVTCCMFACVSICANVFVRPLPAYLSPVQMLAFHSGLVALSFLSTFPVYYLKVIFSFLYS